MDTTPCAAPLKRSERSTDRLYTGQIEEPELGLYFYNARWYDPALGRFIIPDTVVPTTGECNNLSANGFTLKTNSLELMVDYHEFQFLNRLNQENRNKIALRINFPDHEVDTPLVPMNIVAYDRYAYVFNNPLKYTDPTGHSGVSPQDIGEWLRDNINLIWRSAPTWANNFFEGTGRRIIQVDKPHLGYRFYHINSDLKLLKIIDHQNIDPLLTKAAATKTAIDTAYTSMAEGALQITNSSSILLLERIPFFFIMVPSNWPAPLTKKS